MSELAALPEALGFRRGSMSVHMSRTMMRRAVVGSRELRSSSGSILSIVINVAREVNVLTACAGGHSDGAGCENAKMRSAKVRALYTSGQMLDIIPEKCHLLPLSAPSGVAYWRRD